MNSSIEAIKYTTQHQDIKELLYEKERRNFVKVIRQLLDSIDFLPKQDKINIQLISWEDFLTEMSSDLP